MTQQITIQISYATPEKQIVIPLSVDENMSVMEAISLSGVLEQFPDIDKDNLNVGVFYKVIDIETYKLKAGDRLEIYRPLIIDPKIARAAKANKIRGRKWRSSN